MNGNGVKASDLGWRISFALAAVLLSVLGSWFAFGRDAVSESHVQNLINSTSPYSLDRAGIQTKITDLTNEVSALQTREQELELQLIDQRVIIARLQEKTNTK